ncbi:MAG: glycosyltransferase, partial [Pseudomonadota bacterium]
QLQQLRQRYPEVIFRGMLVGDPLAAAYRGADVFVLPSKTDTFGNVLVEAVASGLPRAAYDATGPRNTLSADPALGAVDDDLSEAVDLALQAPGTRASIHDCTVTAYSWKKSRFECPRPFSGVDAMSRETTLRNVFVSDLHIGYEGADI